jgi:hypothetical protein
MTEADIIADWATTWAEKLADRFDSDIASRDASYAENWVFIEATPEADADLDRRLALYRSGQSPR